MLEAIPLAGLPLSYPTSVNRRAPSAHGVDAAAAKAALKEPGVPKDLNTLAAMPSSSPPPPSKDPPSKDPPSNEKT